MCIAHRSFHFDMSRWLLMSYGFRSLIFVVCIASIVFFIVIVVVKNSSTEHVFVKSSDDFRSVWCQNRMALKQIERSLENRYRLK